MAARRAHNPKVPGSSPGPATKIFPINQLGCVFDVLDVQFSRLHEFL